MEICINCNESLTNPICPDCVSNALVLWLKKVKPTAVPLLDSRMELFPFVDEYSSSSNCLKCRTPLNICPECVAQELRDWIKDDHSELLSVIPARFT